MEIEQETDIDELARAARFRRVGSVMADERTPSESSRRPCVRLLTGSWMSFAAFPSGKRSRGGETLNNRISAAPRQPLIGEILAAIIESTSS